LLINLSSGKKDFDSIRQQRYWQNQIFLRWAVEEGLSNGYHKQDLKSWLEDLHKIACSGLDGNNHYYECDSDNGTFSSKSEGVMTRYQEKSTEELKGYLEKFEQFLDLRSSGKNNVQDWLVELAEKYGDIILRPPFKRVNNSIVMNILNLMLKEHEMNEVPHGELDWSFSCYTWDNGKLQRARGKFPLSIFVRAILQTNPTLEKKLGTFLNTTDQFAKDYKLYLDKLSQLYNSGVLSPETYRLMKHLPIVDLQKKCEIFQEIIEFKDLLKKGVQKGVFTDELFTNCLADISKAFDDNLKLSRVLFVKQEGLLLESLGLKLRYPDFDTHVSTIEDLLFRVDSKATELNLGNFDRETILPKAGLNFLNSKDS
jgi:hypothetical protein